MNGLCEKLPNSIFYYVKEGMKHTVIKIEASKY